MEMTNPVPTVAEIEARRERAHVTPAVLCRAALISYVTYYRMRKTGKVGDLTLRRLAAALDQIEAAERNWKSPSARV